MNNVESNLLILKQNPEIALFFEELISLGPSMVLGGAVRDWTLGKPYRDIDIVIDCPASNLEWLKDKYKAEKNRFKGYYLSVSGVEFDVWALDTTWALRNEKSLDRSLDKVPSTVFLTMDAIGYRLDTKEIIDGGFASTFESKQLDIVFEPNPFPFMCVTRALLGLVKYDLRPADNLIRYIEDQKSRGYNKKSFDKFLELRKLEGNFEEAMRRVSHG